MIRSAYKNGMAQALLEKVGALIDISQVGIPEEGTSPLGVLGSAGLTGAGLLATRAFLRGAHHGRSPKSRALWGTIGVLGSLGLGGWLGSRALTSK